MNTNRALLLALVALVALTSACSDEDSVEPDPSSPDAMSDNDRAYLDEYGVDNAFDPLVTGGKEDSTRTGPRVAWEQTDTVWAISHQWTEVSAEEGLAWEANSGLTWEQKYAAWVNALPTQERTPSGTSFTVITPYGLELPAPVLECAEVAMFLRVAFASWYGLPFYMTASSDGSPIYIGHFGFRKSDGSRFGNSPNFKSRYEDFTGQWDGTSAFPSDARLKKRGLYGGGDEHPFLPEVDGEPARAGAYFDALFLNKRTANFMMLLLPWFGSINLASDSNMYHIPPEATSAGDVLLHRWQRGGIGHTMPVMRSRWATEQNLEIAIASGSMPRRQPLWESGASVLWYFTNNHGGGEGMNNDGDEYAALGGGIRRWRAPIASGGRYLNSTTDDAVFIAARDKSALSARPGRFGQLLRPANPDQLRDAAIGRIERAREHLAAHPASCSARERRESGWVTLYEVMEQSFGWTKAQTDSEYRTLQDYVFAELEYNRSRSCCWNSTTAAMHEIIMAYAQREQDEASAAGTCVSPTVFKGEGRGVDGSDGFARWEAFADELGRGDAWVAWSADESCPQANVVDDEERETTWSDFCSIDQVDAPEPITTCSDDDDTRASASDLPAAGTSGRICEGEDVDYHRFVVDSASTVTITLSFSHAAGDLDLLLQDEAGMQVDASQSTNDIEHISRSLDAGTYYLKVYGWNGAAGDYTLTADLGGGGDNGDGGAGSCEGGGPSAEEATSIGAGTHEGLRICSAPHFFSYTATSNRAVSVKINFEHSAGDLDLAVFKGGERIGLSDSTANTETIGAAALSGDTIIIQVYGYAGASNDYTLTIEE